MKQFQIAYQNDESLCKDLEEIKQWCDTNPSYTTLFRVYSADMELGHIKHVCDILDETMPEALYLGCTSHANLLDGGLAKADIILSCTIFEYETTQARVLQLPFAEEDVKETVRQFREYCDANPWVSAVELHATMMGMSVREFCDEMSLLRGDIQVFGGGAYNPNMDDTTTYVFSKGNGFSANGIIFLAFGGDDFHTYSTYIAGWKPLTRQFKVTKAAGATLYELDGEPAFNIYQRYLNITRSDNLISNTLEFPLFMDYKGIDVLRCPLGINEADALMMATEVPENTDVRIAYGDPGTILSSIRHDGQSVADFQPEVIQTFSCAARKAFWGDENIGDETAVFNGIAPTSGLYTGGEFLRIDGGMRNFNITLVLAAMREGDKKTGEVTNLQEAKLDNIESKERIPLIRRFAAFVEATTKELEEANKKLAITSITDGLTSLYNRAEIERGIKKALKAPRPGGLSLIMMDLDNFKKVNDIYGHQEGDRVIIAMSDVLRKILDSVDSAYMGRWGGEEFMVLLQGKGIDAAAELAEQIRAEFVAICFEKAGHQTVSLGVVQAKDGEDADALCSRVDKALYMAKANGKNQVVRL